MKNNLPHHRLFFALLFMLFSIHITAQDCFPDQQPPIPICFNNVTYTLESGESTIMTASEFDAGSTDNCAPDESLLFTFEGSPQTSTLDVTSSSAGVYSIVVFVTDTVGLSSSCTVNYTLVDCDNSSLACNDNVQVILSPSENPVVFEPSDILEGNFCSQSVAFSPDGSVTQLTFDENSPFEQTVTVYDVPTQNSCWGRVVVRNCLMDTTAPVAVCDNLLQVSLDLDGLATLDAQIFDSGSYDWCSDVSYQVRRLGTQFCDFNDGAFGETVTFCCADVDSTVIVQLQVTDASGHTNTCVTETLLKSSIACSNVQGNLLEVSDCASTDTRDLAGWIVTAYDDQSNQVVSRLSNQFGRYYLDLDPGEYTLVAAGPSDYWMPCEEVINITVEADVDLFQDIYQVADVSCSSMYTDVDAAFFRRCFTNRYQFFYGNNGTSDALDAYMDIYYDPILMIENAGVSYTTIGDNTIRVQLGDVEEGEHGQFWIDFNDDCEADFGQAVCIKTEIYPDTICVPSSSNWSGANLSANAICDSDSVRLSIKNNSSAPMHEDLLLYVIEEDIIIFMQEFNLGAGEEILKSYESTEGATFLIASPQEEGHPNDQWVIAGVETCSDMPADPDQLGFLSQFALNSGGLFGDVLCLEAIGSFDPNDKAAQPIGYREEHKILPQSRIDYKIRFQNTGTDTAFNIVVTDQLDPNLDITTMRLGPASHPYEMSVRDDNELVFLFSNVMLPDSNVNEPASNGFFTYSIEVSDRAEIGTKIYNEAAIYFDFNEPIITNEVFHTIDTNFFEIELISGLFKKLDLIDELVVRPNPANELISFDWEGNEDGMLTIYDNLGRLVEKEMIQSGLNTIDVRNLEQGVHFVKVESFAKGLQRIKVAQFIKQ